LSGELAVKIHLANIWADSRMSYDKKTQL